MKRSDIPNMTEEQCNDELVFIELEKMIKKARKYSEKESDETQKIFKALDDMCIDIQSKTNAENANNLEEAIACYIDYGEYGLKNLMKEIRKLYKE